MEHTCPNVETLPVKDMDGGAFHDTTECAACEVEYAAAMEESRIGDDKVVIPRSLFIKLLSRPFYVGVVGTSRHYGGPEEGGWWYDWTDVLDWEEANGWKAGLEIVRRFREEHPTQKYGRHSVLGNGDDTRIIFSRSSAEIESWQSTERPHYE
jgi:hypothetical protein